MLGDEYLVGEGIVYFLFKISEDFGGVWEGGFIWWWEGWGEVSDDFVVWVEISYGGFNGDDYVSVVGVRDDVRGDGVGYFVLLGS